MDVRLANVIAFSDAIAEGSDFAFAPVALSGSIFVPAIYGGTTGQSKGAALTHRNLVANTEQFKAFMPNALRPGQEVVVTALPLYHIFALMVNFITYYSIGAETGSFQSARHGWLHRGSATGALHDFHRREHAVRRLAHASKIAEVDFSDLRVAIGGGAAVLPTTSAKWKAITGKDILEGYGLSETSPILTLNPATRDGFSATVGLPFPPPTSSCWMPPMRQPHRRAGRDLRQRPASDARLLAKA